MHPHHLVQCKRINQQLYKSKNGLYFREPVDPFILGLPDYFSIIQKPMDLGTIKNNLAQMKYTTVEEFAEDIRLVFSNCFTYNRPGSQIFKMASQLSKTFEDYMRDFDRSEPEITNAEVEAMMVLANPQQLELLEDEEDDDFSDDGFGVSEYERKRLENIARNREMMKSLGLDFAGLQASGIKQTSSALPSPPKRKTYHKQPILAPTRSSKRKKGFQYSPLFTAVRDNDLERVWIILAEGSCDINEKNGINDESALHLAATIGSKEIVTALLQHEGIEVDSRDIRGWTPLAIAQTNGFKDIGDMLTEAGATPIEDLDQDAKRKTLPKAFTTWSSHVPVAPNEQNRCTCCHTCRTSLTIYPREFKGCSSCPYIYCQNCFNKGQIRNSTWEEVQSDTEWVCEVCFGSCVCSRCCTRGPPRWFGHKNPKWRNPETAEKERSAYKAKALEAHEERLTSPPEVITSPKDRKGQPYQYQQMCTCCHICRKSVASTDIPYLSCSSCAYIICKPCFGKRIPQTWEEAKQIDHWSCTVCHGTCSCGRCKKRGPPGWYGQLKKMKVDPTSLENSLDSFKLDIDQPSKGLMDHPILMPSLESVKLEMDSTNEFMVALNRSIKAEHHQTIMNDGVDDEFSPEVLDISQPLDSSFLDGGFFNDCIDPVYG